MTCPKSTTSIETSELISKKLKKRKIKHEVLNAKQHEREAQIVEQAGRPGAVTIATNMAGRGTDIVLGGSLDAELAELGEDATDEQKSQAKEEIAEMMKQPKAAPFMSLIVADTVAMRHAPVRFAMRKE